MPWLTVHITLPLIFLAGWAFGRFFDSVNWTRMKNSRGWVLALLILVLTISTSRALGYLLGPEAPFQGSTLNELKVTNGFLAAAGIYALDHHLAHLGEDHARARELARGAGEIPGLWSTWRAIQQA